MNNMIHSKDEIDVQSNTHKKIRVTSNLNGVNKMIIMSNLTPHNDIWTKTIY